MPKKVAVILSGCGKQDGAEIHESVLTLLALDRAGATYEVLAPDKPQRQVVNHATGQEVKQTRNVLVEAARIARGAVKDIARAKGSDYDAVILPGGYGAALNLSDFALRGAECTVDEHVARFLREAHQAGRPIGAICIAPAVVARVFGPDLHPTLTIGSDTATAAALEKMGARHEVRRVDQIAVDEKNKIVTTPAYMLAQRISEVATGIERLVEAVLRLA
jgi:enhancing lycopene biosynthesis protein 2